MKTFGIVILAGYTWPAAGRPDRFLLHGIFPVPPCLVTSTSAFALWCTFSFLLHAPVDVSTAWCPTFAGCAAHADLVCKCLHSPFPAGTVVAVKVRHPGVGEAIQRDFALMMRVARLTSILPLLSHLRLEDTLAQFAAPLREQVRRLYSPVYTLLRICLCRRGCDY